MISNGKNIICCDIECDGLLDKVSKIHCIGWWQYGSKEPVQTTTDYNEMQYVLNNADIIIMHNGFLYDAIVIKNILGIDISNKVFDTLPLSWYLYPKRYEHGLDSWAADVGLLKPAVSDWENQDISVYLNRVTEDTKIQANLFFKLWKELNDLYENNTKDAFDLWQHLNKLMCIFYYQYFNPFTVDEKLLDKNINKLQEEKLEIENSLSKHMPPVPVYKEKSPPKNMYKKDGTLSSLGVKWFEFLKDNSLDLNTNKSIKYVDSYEPPNPSSDQQVKDWLFSLGWKPCTFKDAVNVKGETTKVPQIKDADKNLTKSVLDLADSIPELKLLEKLTVINHRLGLLKGFRRDAVNGKLYGDIAGITNTLRVRHRRIVNLPKPNTPYGEYIRACLKAPDNFIICGSDIASLENYTRTNLICDLDPNSITELLDPDFDTHLDLAVFGGFMTQEESNFYKDVKKLMKSGNASNEQINIFEKLDKIRHNVKTVNYSALYGVGVAKLSKSIGEKQSVAQKLLDAYWEKNWAVRALSESAKVKVWNGLKWILNPINGIWYELRSDKDRFSSLNQGLGSFIATEWIHRIIDTSDIRPSLYMHDELQSIILDSAESKENTEKILQKSIQYINNYLSLRVPIRIDIKFGYNYAETH